ncbi:MAG: FIG021250: possible hydrolase, partial [uncultured Blastococcus sp.]
DLLDGRLGPRRPHGPPADEQRALDHARRGRRRRPRTARGRRGGRHPRRGADRSAPRSRGPAARGRGRRPPRVGRCEHPGNGRAAGSAGRGARGEAGQPPRSAGHRHRLAGHRHPGRRAARLPLLAGAGAVRDLRDRRPPAAGGAEHRGHRAEARRGPLGLPALGLPARDHPPAAVHRRPVAQGTPGVRDRPVRGRHRPHPRRAARAPAGRPAQRARRRPRRRGRVRGADGAGRRPGAACRPRPGHRGHEPRGGSRRVRHGRRGSRRRPDRAHAAQALRPAAQGPRPAGPRAAPPAGPRAEDEAVRRGADLRRRGHRPGGDGGLQPRLGGPGEPAPDRGDHRPGPVGGAGARPPGHPGL